MRASYLSWRYIAKYVNNAENPCLGLYVEDSITVVIVTVVQIMENERAHGTIGGIINKKRFYDGSR